MVLKWKFVTVVDVILVLAMSTFINGHCSNVPLINELSVKATCQTSTGIHFPCTSHIPPGTVAEIKCKEGYTLPDHHVETTTVCEADGLWTNRIFKCKQICGIIDEGHTGHTTVSEEETNLRQMPWQAAIYEIHNSRYNQICGGSIITPTAVVSAAHCFWNRVENKFKDEQDFQVIVGKTMRDYYANDTLRSQVFNITYIDVSEQYNDYNGLYTEDIAIAVLASPIIYNSFVKPVCIDQNLHYGDKHMAANVSGRVAGWGLPEEGNNSGNNSDALKVVDLKSVDYHTCKKHSLEGFRSFITIDKFCAGEQQNNTICSGYNGGGFVVPHKEVNETIYYLAGIVSVGAFSRKECVPDHFTLFTNIQYFAPLTYKYVYKYL